MKSKFKSTEHAVRWATYSKLRARLKICFYVFCVCALVVLSFYLLFKISEQNEQEKIDYNRQIENFLKEFDLNPKYNSCLEQGYYNRISDKEVLECLEKIK